MLLAYSSIGSIQRLSIRGFQTLAIEILSEGNRKLDETIKRQRYEHYGIPEYWIIDPALDQVKIYRLADGRYGQASVLSLEAQDVLTTPLLPAMSLPLTALFKEAIKFFSRPHHPSPTYCRCFTLRPRSRH